MKFVFTLLAVIALASVSIFTSSCATAAGFGRDMQSLGEALENAAS